MGCDQDKKKHAYGRNSPLTPPPPPPSPPLQGTNHKVACHGGLLVQPRAHVAPSVQVAEPGGGGHGQDSSTHAHHDGQGVRGYVGGWRPCPSDTRDGGFGHRDHGTGHRVHSHGHGINGGAEPLADNSEGGAPKGAANLRSQRGYRGRLGCVVHKRLRREAGGRGGGRCGVRDRGGQGAHGHVHGAPPVYPSRKLVPDELHLVHLTESQSKTSRGTQKGVKSEGMRRREL